MKFQPCRKPCSASTWQHSQSFHTLDRLQISTMVWLKSCRSYSQQETVETTAVSLSFSIYNLLLRVAVQPPHCHSAVNGYQREIRRLLAFKKKSLHIMCSLRCFFSKPPSKAMCLSEQFCACLVSVICRRSCVRPVRPGYHLWFWAES